MLAGRRASLRRCLLPVRLSERSVVSMGLFSGLFRVGDTPQNRTSGSAYSFFMGGSTGGNLPGQYLADNLIIYRISFAKLARLPLGLIPWQPLFQVGPVRINNIPNTLYARSAFSLLAGWESSILRASSFARSSAARDAMTKSSSYFVNEERVVSLFPRR